MWCASTVTVFMQRFYRGPCSSMQGDFKKCCTFAADILPSFLAGCVSGIGSTEGEIAMVGKPKNQGRSEDAIGMMSGVIEIEERKMKNWKL